MKELEKSIKDKSFAELTFLDQKKILKEILNLNQLYLPFSEIEDKSYEISEKDIKASKEFYDKK